MPFTVQSIFQPNYTRYDGVRPIHVYLMRLLYVLMALVLGKEVWTHILNPFRRQPLPSTATRMGS